ncbi:MAG: hypothetical protein JWP89_5456 [Schlesneria sp.]|nr:hypothetical protein [Schlesneria sp.]
MQLRDRIKSLVRVKAGDLLPSPKNWRVHTDNQRNVLQSLLAQVGLVDAVLVRETENGLQLIDGHLRALLDGEAMLPALILNVTDEEADLILAMFDPVSAAFSVGIHPKQSQQAPIARSSMRLRVISLPWQLLRFLRRQSPNHFQGLRSTAASYPTLVESAFQQCC